MRKGNMCDVVRHILDASPDVTIKQAYLLAYTKWINQQSDEELYASVSTDNTGEVSESVKKNNGFECLVFDSSKWGRITLVDYVNKSLMETELKIKDIYWIAFNKWISQMNDDTLYQIINNKGSNYRTFMRDEIDKIKTNDTTIDHKDAFRQAHKAWIQIKTV